MITKQEFIDRAFETIDQYPTLSLRYKAKDPRLIQNIEAMATMLSMISSQIDVSQSEKFEKTRDTTVLADAAMRGIIPKGTPAKISVSISNNSDRSITLSKGRQFLDNAGRYLVLDSDVTTNAASTQTATLSQFYTVTSKFKIKENRPFYELPINLSNDDSVLCGLTVMDDRGHTYAYTDRYAGATAGDRIYHIEVDERQNFYIRFGYASVVGVQLDVNAVVTVTAAYTRGYIGDYAVGDKVSLSVGDIFESKLDFSILSVEQSGEDPIGIGLMRELAKYPSIYNKKAVYMGEFDLLVRSSFNKLAFLSVWNEAVEEAARGANLDNMNCLFVAIVGSDLKEPYAFEHGAKLAEITTKTDLQQKVETLIRQADNSYRVRFVVPKIELIKFSVYVKVPSSYDRDAIKKQVREIVLSNYGRGSIRMSRGRQFPLYQDVSELLKENIGALSVIGSDFRVYVDDESKTVLQPEIWRYVDDSSLEIKVSSQSVSAISWGVGL